MRGSLTADGRVSKVNREAGMRRDMSVEQLHLPLIQGAGSMCSLFTLA